jgi:hypothetical protein
MRLMAKFTLFGFGAIILAGVVLFVGGCLSKPRDFASPSATVCINDPDHVPIVDLEVSRNWYDSDVGNDGSDYAAADKSGNYIFPKIPAKVGLFTGAWRKAYSQLGMCGAGSGTYTEIYIRFHGHYDVLPQNKLLHSAGQSHQDPNGVWFDSDLDSNSNTLVHLKFPSDNQNINYVLMAKRKSEQEDATKQPFKNQ